MEPTSSTSSSSLLLLFAVGIAVVELLNVFSSLVGACCSTIMHSSSLSPAELPPLSESERRSMTSGSVGADDDNDDSELVRLVDLVSTEAVVAVADDLLLQLATAVAEFAFAGLLLFVEGLLLVRPFVPPSSSQFKRLL